MGNKRPVFQSDFRASAWVNMKAWENKVAHTGAVKRICLQCKKGERTVTQTGPITTYSKLCASCQEQDKQVAST